MAASVTSGGQTISFSYDSGHARLTQASAQTTTTYLRDPISGAYEEDISSSSGTITKNHYVTSGEVVWTVSGSSVTVTPRYFHRDGLGSISALTDAAGNVVEQDRYDAWGKRRYPNGGIDTNDAITSQTDRGYIGEETLASAGLMDLNARLYDPLTGRFVTADPIGQRGGANLYAYAGNNPLTYSDPTGLCFLGCFWKPIIKSPIFRAVVAIAAVYVLQQYEVLPALEADAGLAVSSEAAVTSYGLENAAILGAVGGAISTGTWKGALIGAAAGAAFYEAGDLTYGHANADGNFVTPDGIKTPGAYFTSEYGVANVVLHGEIGALASAAGGGGLGAGGFSAAFADAGGAFGYSNNLAIGSAEAAGVGGIGSVLGGGKFENGAITGAFGYLFNEAGNGFGGLANVSFSEAMGFGAQQIPLP